MEHHEIKSNLAPVVRSVLAKPPGLKKVLSANCWENNVSEQFPIQQTNQVDGEAEILVRQPHQGYVIKTTIVDSKMNGESQIFSNRGVHIATLTYVDGIASGPCRINDESGLLWFEGRFENGYRQGKGTEYDKNGNTTFEGFYERGKKLRLYRMEEMKGYWKEISADDKVVSIGEKDDGGRNSGICYYYDNDQISQISKFENGVETPYSGYIKLFDEPHKLWFEGFVENGYRQGKGKEYNKNGSITFEGFYERGKKLRLYRMEEMKGYWKEIDEDNTLIRICQKDDEGLNNGICYMYTNGVISRISYWENGKEVQLLKQFFGQTMIEYQDGKKKYQGEYKYLPNVGYIRYGEGEEYAADGQTLRFKGSFISNVRHGVGITYKKNTLKKKQNWVAGCTIGGLITLFIFIAILLILPYLIDAVLGISIMLLVIAILQCIKFCMNDKNGKKMCFKRTKMFSHCVLKNHIRNVRNSDALSDIGFQMLIFILFGILAVISLGILLFYSIAIPYISIFQSTYIIKDNRLNWVHYFTISENPRLTEIRIGSKCVKSAKTFKIERLPSLVSLTIGSNSFTKKRDGYGSDKSKSIHVSNCTKLQSIEIGRYSFSDYAGDFELTNLPLLQSIKIGLRNSNSYNFYSSSFIIQSIYCYISELINRSSSIEIHRIRRLFIWKFGNVHDIISR